MNNKDKIVKINKHKLKSSRISSGNIKFFAWIKKNLPKIYKFKTMCPLKLIYLINSHYLFKVFCFK